MKYPDEDFVRFAAWAREHHLRYDVPTPARSLAAYLQALVDEGKTYSTIEKRCFGVSLYNLRQAADPENPPPKLSKDPSIKTLLGDVRKNFARQRKDALLPEGVRAIARALRSCEPMTPACYRDIAIIMLQRGTGVKLQAVAELTRARVHIRKGVLYAHVRRAGRQPETVKVYAEADTEICPVRAMSEYLEVLGPTPGDAPLFRAVTPETGELRRVGITRRDATRVLKRAADLAGIDPEKIGAQSLRLGRIAEVVAEVGVDHAKVAEQVGYTETAHLTPFIAEAHAKRRSVRTKVRL